MKTFKKKHLFWSVPALVISLTFACIVLFSEQLVEKTLVYAGVGQGQVGRAHFGLGGTVLNNVTLPRLGVTIQEIRLYATLGDLAHARLGNVFVKGITWQLPAQAADNTDSQEASLAGLRTLLATLDTYSNEIQVEGVNLAISPDLPVIAGKGVIYDRGDRYQINFEFATPLPEADQPQALNVAATLNADVFKKTGAAKIQADIQQLDINMPSVLIAKRVAGWASLELPQDATTPPLLGAQIDAGALRLYDVPLTKATMTLSGDAKAVRGLLSAHLPEREGQSANTNGVEGEFNLLRTDSNETLNARLSVKLDDLDTLGVSDVGGSANIALNLQATKAASSNYIDIASYTDIGGTLDLSARNLSLAKAFSKATAKLSGKLAYDPATQKIAFNTTAPLAVTAQRTGQNISLNAAHVGIDYSAADTAAHIQASQFDISVPAVKLSDGAVDVTVSAFDVPVAEGKISATVTSLAKPALFVPLKLMATLASLSSQPHTTGLSAIISGANGALMIKANGRHDSSAQKGSMQTQLVQLQMQEGISSLEEFFPVAGQYVDTVTGTMGAASTFNWNKGKQGWQISQSGQLLLRDLGANYNGFPVQGINTVITLSSLAPPVFDHQQVAIGAFTAGLPLQNGIVTLSMNTQNQLTVHDGHMDMAGGTIGVEPFTLDMNEQNADIVLKADNLDLGQLFAIAPLEGLTAEGRMQGTLPITMRAGNLTLSDGQLNSIGGGAIRYSPRELPAFLKDDTSQQIVDLRTALANFNFSSLKMGLRGDLLKQQTVTLNIEGKNPDFYSGHPVKLNLNVEGPLQNIVRYAPGSKNIPDAIQKQIEQFEDANATAAP